MSSYETLASNTTNPLTKRLLSIILSKKSNLAVSIDVTSPESLVSIIRAVGPYVCIVKVLSMSLFN
jgi:orotidine-5'-phosphate decarboxylase